MAILNRNEDDAAEEFRAKHRCKPKATRILQITITPTSIADSIKVKCTVCGKTKDITDYGSW